MDAPLEEGAADGVVYLDVQFAKFANATTAKGDPISEWESQFPMDYLSLTVLDFVSTERSHRKVLTRIKYGAKLVGTTVAVEVLEGEEEQCFCFQESFAFQGAELSQVSLELVDFESQEVFGKVLFLHWDTQAQSSLWNAIQHSVTNIHGDPIGHVVMRLRRLKAMGASSAVQGRKERVVFASLASMMGYTSAVHQFQLGCECFGLYGVVWLLAEPDLIRVEASALWWCMLLVCVCTIWHLCWSIYQANMATWKACEKTMKLKVTSEELKAAGIQVDLPQWFTFPDTEKAEWLNEALGIVWPQTKAAIQAAMIKAARSSGIFDVEIAHFGDLPPSVTGMKAYDKSKLSRQVMMDVDVEFSNSIVVKFALKIGPLRLSVWVTSLSFSGCVRLTLEQFIPSFPCFSKVGVSFIIPPKVNIDVDLGLISLNSLPGGNWCLNAVMNHLLRRMHWPLTLDLSVWEPLNAADKIDLHKRAKGVLRVHVLSANGLRNVDWFTLSDPYCNIFVHDGGKLPKKHRTKIVDNCLAPVWDERKEFVVEDPRSLVTFVVKDDDTIGKNQVLGEARLRVSDLGVNIRADLSLPLMHLLNPHGSVQACLEWKPLGEEIREWHSEEGWSVAVVSLYIDSISNLFGGESAYDSADCYIKVRCGSVEERTATIHSSSPAFRQHFSLLVHDIKLQKVKISVHSDTLFSNHTLGTLIYDLRDVISSKGLSGSFALENNPFRATIDLDINLRTIESDAHEVAVEGLDNLRSHLLELEMQENMDVPDSSTGRLVS